MDGVARTPRPHAAHLHVQPALHEELQAQEAANGEAQQRHAGTQEGVHTLPRRRHAAAPRLLRLALGLRGRAGGRVGYQQQQAACAAAGRGCLVAHSLCVATAHGPPRCAARTTGARCRRARAMPRSLCGSLYGLGNARQGLGMLRWGRGDGAATPASASSGWAPVVGEQVIK